MYFVGAKLLNSSDYIISEDPLNEYAMRMNLTINRLKKNDFGEYTCSAANAYGRANATILLKGLSKFIFQACSSFY